jgi:hypothetical protein
MGLFDFLSDVAKRVVDSAEQQPRNSGGSAIPSGRMRETDKIKGAGSSIPHDPGEYRHRSKATGEVQYVGQTNDLRTRQQQHARDGKLDTDKQYVQYSAAKSGASKADLCKTEVNHIARHKPSGNTTKGGNGRR